MGGNGYGSGMWKLLDEKAEKWVYVLSNGTWASGGWMYLYNPYSKDVEKNNWFCFDDDGIIGLHGFLYDPMPHPVSFERLLVMLDLIPHLLCRVCMLKVFLQHEMQRLADASCLDSFHSRTSLWRSPSLKHDAENEKQRGKQLDLRSYATRCYDYYTLFF